MVPDRAFSTCIVWQELEYGWPDWHLPDRFLQSMTGDELVPYAEGKILVVAPETEAQRMTIKALKGNLQLIDDRKDRKASWFIVRSPLP